MKISFVIPAYNEEAVLGACLESILAEIARTPEVELGKTAEVVVVNNASTDHTKEVALSFPGVQVVDEPAKGLVRARHAGFIATQGEIVANIDADTVMPQGWLRTTLDHFREEQLAALSGPYIHYDFSPGMRMLVKVYYASAWITHWLLHRIFNKGAILQGGNFVLRREAWERAGGFDTTIEFYGEDTDVAKRIAKQGRVRFTFALPIYTTARRMHHEGIVRTVWHYLTNFFAITVTGKPATKEYTDIRPH